MEELLKEIKREENYNNYIFLPITLEGILLKLDENVPNVLLLLSEEHDISLGILEDFIWELISKRDFTTIH